MQWAQKSLPKSRQIQIWIDILEDCHPYSVSSANTGSFQLKHTQNTTNIGCLVASGIMKWWWHDHSVPFSGWELEKKTKIRQESQWVKLGSEVVGSRINARHWGGKREKKEKKQEEREREKDGERIRIENRERKERKSKWRGKRVSIP